MERKVYEALDAAVGAYKNSAYQFITGAEMASKWGDVINHIEKNYLPNGSGFDRGTKVVEEKCVNGVKLVLSFDYHHMDENGYYDGWTSHTVVVAAHFDGIRLKVQGALPRKYRHNKEYFEDTMYHALTRTINHSEIRKFLTQEEANASKS